MCKLHKAPVARARGVDIARVELAEQLVGEARERRKNRMDVRELLVDSTSAALFMAAAISVALWLPSDRTADPALIVALVAGYALVSRVRFEFGEAYVSPEDLVFVPMLLVLPISLVPLLVAAAAVISVLPEILGGDWHKERWISSISHSWALLGPVIVIGLLAPGEPGLANIGVYVAAFGAQVALDYAWAVGRDRLLEPLPLAELTRNFLATVRVSVVLWSLGLILGLQAMEAPLVLVVIGPLVWLLAVFSRDRQERYTATLELNRAYRGTVMLLADVVEFDDKYTASHSRSVVELVQSVADEMGVDRHSRQELEFAALLHDVGKISIPKEILNKPAKLSADEFELMKGHTIEGQFMLDRVGGLLAKVGELVRSCHERWDGTGYPDGLAGEEIPLPARIVFTCDAYNAMTTDRPYRAAMPQEDALEELATNAGTQFDPTVVEALRRVVTTSASELGTSDQVRALLARVHTADPLRAAG
jgi:HD-GYP domain-containing protein (c-di-GMP phosphodiesterase class II)